MTIQEFLEFMGDRVNVNNILNPKENRDNELDYDYVPSSEEEFYQVIDKAPFSFLKGLGFRKYATLNEIISENRQKKVSDKLDIPIVYGEDFEDILKGIEKVIEGKVDNTISLEFGRGNAPIDLLPENMDIILFPKEWYDSIPHGFKTTTITGEIEPFDKEYLSEESRYGCLAYGITRGLEPESNDVYLISELRGE